MMRRTLLCCMMLVGFGLSSCGQKVQFAGNGGCPPPDHLGWTQLLQRHVDSLGHVNYAGFVADSLQLNTYLALLASCPPSDNWTANERLAYWINVYNAFTIKLIADHYPVTSIKHIKRGIPMINSVWEMEFFRIGETPMSLSTVEHRILREEFDEPRIHFAIVCASISCPTLRNEAYSADRLEQQLHEQTVRFINDPSKNQIDRNEIRLSPIFKWFNRDFTRQGSLLEFIGAYSHTPLSENTRLKYLDYNWGLNGE